MNIKIKHRKILRSPIETVTNVAYHLLSPPTVDNAVRCTCLSAAIPWDKSRFRATVSRTQWTYSVTGRVGRSSSFTPRYDSVSDKGRFRPSRRDGLRYCRTTCLTKRVVNTCPLSSSSPAVYNGVPRGGAKEYRRTHCDDEQWRWKNNRTDWKKKIRHFSPSTARLTQSGNVLFRKQNGNAR